MKIPGDIKHNIPVLAISSVALMLLGALGPYYLSAFFYVASVICYLRFHYKHPKSSIRIALVECSVILMYFIILSINSGQIAFEIYLFGIVIASLIGGFITNHMYKESHKTDI